MKIEVRHFADPEETISAIPGKVTVAVLADDGMAIVGGDPIELTLGQQADVEVEGRITGNESIIGLAPGTRPEVHLVGRSVQAVIDPAPPVEGAMCNGRCVDSPNIGVTNPDPDCPLHARERRRQRRQPRPDWPAEAVEAQHRQIKAAIELAVRELRSPQTNEQRARLLEGLQDLLDGNAALAVERQAHPDWLASMPLVAGELLVGIPVADIKVIAEVERGGRGQTYWDAHGRLVERLRAALGDGA